MMNLINSGQIEIKKSKFISYYYEVNSLDEVKTILNDIKSEHKKARHVAYAYRLDNTAGKSDDKEPAGSAGLPLYNILIKKDINNALLVVVRYFGGIRLGFGPLTRAYSSAGMAAIKDEL